MDATDTTGTSAPLLPPWHIARDPATGKFYYYNTTTGVVQWEPPGITDTTGTAADASATGVKGEASFSEGIAVKEWQSIARDCDDEFYL